MTESISRVTPGSDTTQLRSLVVGYEPVVGCDNLRDKGADLRRPENTPGASAGGLVRAKTYLGKAIGARSYRV